MSTTVLNPAQFFGISTTGLEPVVKVGLEPVVSSGLDLVVEAGLAAAPVVREILLDPVVAGATTLAPVVRAGLAAVVGVLGVAGVWLELEIPKAGPTCSWYIV